MEKVDLTRQFAYRLRDAMLEAGLNSKRSTSGVDIHQLAKITGYSSQICRKYLRGEAIPEPAKLAEIAKALCVSPGWLLFGSSHSDVYARANHITLNKNVLQHIFFQATALYNAGRSRREIADFLLELTSDVSQIDASDEQLKKIVDLALASAKHFSHGSS